MRNEFLFFLYGHPHNMFRFPCHRPTDRPMFLEKRKKKNSESLVEIRSKYFTLQAHDLVLLTPIVTPRNQAFVVSSPAFTGIRFLEERESDRKRNILLGWPMYKYKHFCAVLLQGQLILTSFSFIDPLAGYDLFGNLVSISV